MLISARSQFDILNIKNKNICDDIINNPDNKLTVDQSTVFKSIFSFLLGIVEKKELSQHLNNHFIPDLSNLIVSKISYLDHPKTKDKMGLLIGGAGTGKTYMVSNIILKLSSLMFASDDIVSNIHILAPTNKAIKVIRKKIYDTVQENDKENDKVQIMPVNIYFKTISKFLEQDLKYTQNGTIIYKTKVDVNKSIYRGIKYIIIDESSMISKNNWDDLNTHVFKKLKNVKILLIGDDCQLPPVKESSSVVFNIKCKKFKLKDIVRTQSPEISNIYTLYRNSVINNKDTSNSIKSVKDFKYIKSFKNIIKNEFDVLNDKVISYSNDSVDKYNELVRNIVFNEPEEEYVIGEKLIFGSSVKFTNINLSILEGKYQYANDEATVINLESTVINTNFSHKENNKFNLKKIFPEQNFDVYRLRLYIDDGTEITVNKVKEHSMYSFEEYFTSVFDTIKVISRNRKVKKDHISKLWDIFYIIKNTINIPIKYSYALTVYKSQGSTFNKIYVDLENINDCVKNNNILFKTLYTAITRGSKKINCYKPTVSDYYMNDLDQFPYLKKYIKIDNKKAYDILKDGKNIMYTRNEYQNKNIRKLVKGKVIHIIGKNIYVGNSNFSWTLKIKDDIIIYL